MRLCPASRSRLLTLLLAAAWPTSEVLAAGAKTTGLPARIDAFAKAERERQKIPGLALAVIKDGQVLKAAGYGLANLEHQVPVKTETVFQSGSLGKQFTAAALMLLAEDGKVRLDDSIRRYFADAPQTWAPITVRHLLTHTSGVPNYGPDTLDLRRDYTEEELARFAYGLALEFPAGSRWSYTNTGYVLLGGLIRKAGGRFYGDVLRERVFAPLGMKTARVISEADIVPNRAAGYRLVDGEVRNQEWVAPVLNTTADGSLYVTVLDLVAWDQGLRSKAILKPESWGQVFAPVTLTSGKRYPYGFGWEVEEVAAGMVHRHGGSWQGFQAHIARYIDAGLTIIVLANLADADTEPIAEGIAGLVDPKLAKPELRPIPDLEPAATARLRDVLAQAARGDLAPTAFAYVPLGLSGALKEYEKLLRPLGSPTRLDLLERRELGDDKVYLYEAAYGATVLRVRLGLAPDGRVALFVARPK